MSKPWFKQRRYGYGWSPASWQGLVIMAIYFAIVATDILLLMAAGKNPDWADAVRFVAVLVIATGFLIAVAARTGGRPRWQWGNRDDNE